MSIFHLSRRYILNFSLHSLNPSSNHGYGYGYSTIDITDTPSFGNMDIPDPINSNTVVDGETAPSLDPMDFVLKARKDLPEYQLCLFVKPSADISTKGGNRHSFVKSWVTNIKYLLNSGDFKKMHLSGTKLPLSWKVSTAPSSMTPFIYPILNSKAISRSNSRNGDGDGDKNTQNDEMMILEKRLQEINSRLADLFVFHASVPHSILESSFSKGINGGKYRTDLDIDRSLVPKLSEYWKDVNISNFDDPALKSIAQEWIKSITRCSRTFGTGSISFSLRLQRSRMLEPLIAVIKYWTSLGSISKDFQFSSFRITLKGLKDFPWKSDVIYSELAGTVIDTARETWGDAPLPTVSLEYPEKNFTIELKREEIFFYCNTFPGPKGLPISTTGRGISLISGGFDSPIASWQMQSRGLLLDMVHFHSKPVLSSAGLEKAIDLTSLLAAWQFNPKNSYPAIERFSRKRIDTRAFWNDESSQGSVESINSRSGLNNGLHSGSQSQMSEIHSILSEKIEAAYEKASSRGETLFFSVPFINIQDQIKASCNPRYFTVLFRRFMFRISQVIGYSRGAQTIISGESLGQVASQTLENMIASAAPIDTSRMIVSRPLLGMEKTAILQKAAFPLLDTFHISCEPDADTCTLYTPPNPILYATDIDCSYQERKLGTKVDDLVLEAIRNTDVISAPPNHDTQLLSF